MIRHLTFLLLGFLVVLPVTARPADAAPKADLWARWLQHDPRSTTTVDDAAWAQFLERHVRAGPTAP